MAYQKGSSDEPGLITLEELMDRSQHFDRVYLNKWDSKHAGHVHRGQGGGTVFQPENIGGPSRRYLKPGNIVFAFGPERIGEPGYNSGPPKKYVLVDTAKDITENDLAKYADDGFNCMFKMKKNVVFGELSLSSDGYPVLRYAYLEKENHPYFRDNVLIPDDTVIVLVDFETPAKGHAKRKTVWGVTSFAFEDSVEIKNKS